MAERLWAWGGAALAAGGLLLSSLYTLDAREVAVVTAFGRPVRSVTEPGLYTRAPWPLHQVVRFDARARVLTVKASELLTRDKKNLVIEAFAVWRVADPERFLESVGREQVAETQLSDLVTSEVASAFGQREFAELLAVDRKGSELLPDAARQAIARVARERLGVEVLDVRLRHLGLPLQNEQSIYERMRAERLRIANAYRSEGEQEAATITAAADREVAALYAEAYRADPGFYRYLSTLDSYEDVLGEGTIVVLDADGGYLDALSKGPR